MFSFLFFVFLDICEPDKTLGTKEVASGSRNVTPFVSAGTEGAGGSDDDPGRDGNGMCDKDCVVIVTAWV